MQDISNLKRRLIAKRETAVRKTAVLLENIKKLDAALAVLGQIDLGEEFRRGDKTTVVLEVGKELGVFTTGALMRAVVAKHPQWRGAERNVRNIFEKQYKLGRFVLVNKGGSPRYPSTYKVANTNGGA